MPIVNSPLRYPGGKAKIASLLAKIINLNDIRDGIYVEPFAGGAGAALDLLFSENVSKIYLNDADPCIYSFWQSVLYRTDEFINYIYQTPISIKEWKKQKDVYRNKESYTDIEIAFASFYLNRCNRSGIIDNGGPIGGINQAGKWKLDARFNKKELVRRIEKIQLYKDRIVICNLDAMEYLKMLKIDRNDKKRIFVYLDPPYYEKGYQLYFNHLRHGDHMQLAAFVKRELKFKWLMTYDNVPEINELYSDCACVPFKLNYSAHIKKIGSELLIYSKTLNVPKYLIN